MLINSPVSSHTPDFSLVSAYGNNSRKQTAPLTDTFFNSRGCTRTRELTGLWWTDTHHLKQQPDELLWLAPVLGGEGGGGHVEECGPTLCGHCFGQHGLTSSWWPNHAHTLRRKQRKVSKNWWGNWPICAGQKLWFVLWVLTKQVLQKAQYSTALRKMHDASNWCTMHHIA